MTLEIENPLAVCGHCRFTVPLRGEWSVEGGRLVFRADADPQPGRGPDLDHCGESDRAVEFKRITVGGKELSREQAVALRETAGRADGH